ncbi:MAG: 2-C-methyl-D-erythritol 4-phosphate cytidylyltransferase [Bifidobacteriaceae bacterium]|nr:2-C-methyl-D-erythritol 4-phosphate cytidylyltransferase [Bifidobacteriaceae bacterium]
MKTIAVVLAGGIGERVGSDVPKQMIRIAGKPIIIHTLEALQSIDAVDEIMVVMNETVIDEFRELLNEQGICKVEQIIKGGATRNDSAYNAIKALNNRFVGEEVKVVIHDAVRPFVDENIVMRCINTLDEYEAVDVCIKSADTIVGVDKDEIITRMPTRDALRRGQTPQAFLLSTITKAYELGLRDPNFKATDDCRVVFEYTPEVKIKVVDGTDENMKITEPLDIQIADKLFQLRTESFDQELSVAVDKKLREHLEGKNIVVLGGTYGIGLETAELAESYGANVHIFSRTVTGTDISDARTVKKALKSVGTKIDAIIITAGILSFDRLADLGLDSIKQTVDINLLGPLQTAAIAYPYLAESNGALILFTSSSYTRGRANYAAYSATKAGVVNLTQALADEWADDNIRVNCINPQRTATPLRTRAFGDEPPETLLDPKSVALVTLKTLVSDLTGQIVDVTLK